MGVRIDHATAKRFGIRAGKPNKYRARRTEYNGVMYASRAEADRALILDLMVRDGSVLWWIGQPIFRLGCPENKYIADFIVVSPGFFSESQVVRVEDVKGHETREFKKNKRLWKLYGPCPLWIITKGGIEVIEPESR